MDKELIEKDCKIIGGYDVEKLALQNFKSNDDGFISYEDRYNGFIEGFKTAQSLNDKKFSLEDIEKAIEMARYTTNSKNSIIQSVQQTRSIIEQIIIMLCGAKGN